MNTNFKYYSDLYLKFGKEDWKNSTYDKNKSIVYKRLSYFFDYDIRFIKATDIKEWLSSIKDVGAKSKKHYISSLSSIFKLALENEAIDKNPIIHLKKIKSETPNIEPFSADEVKEILKTAEKINNYNFYIFLCIGFYTGLRTGEILALKKYDIDLHAKTISVNATRSRHGESVPKTAKSKRIVPILDDLYNPLKNFLAGFYSRTYVLTTFENKPYRDTAVFTKHWQRVLKKLNLPYRRLYIMRHTYATNMLSRGLVTPVELCNLLGHTNPKMIYDVYVNYINKNMHEFDRSIKVYS